MEMIEENALTSGVCVCTFFYCSKLCIMYLEEEMATHSGILAWTIPWIEEPGGLQSMGSQRVRHG